MENEIVTELEIRDAIYSHVCQLVIAGVKGDPFNIAIKTYERAYGVKIAFRDTLLKTQEDSR